MQENWSQGLDAFDAFITEITQPRQIDEKLRLDPRTELPFFGILEEEVKRGSRRFAIPVNSEGMELEESERLQLADFTRDMVRIIRQRLVNNDDFWLFPENKEDLRKQLGDLLEVDTFIHRVGVAPRGIRVQPLGYRWGSCGRNNTLYFHWRTILLPSPIIDYIIVHELVHLRERHHKRSFWERVEQALPDYASRKRWLAEYGNSL